MFFNQTQSLKSFQTYIYIYMETFLNPQYNSEIFTYNCTPL